ncbi:MAG: thiolase family protein [Alphaproteobacteria bacterium]|nr:thiolase family protein [Alphaproteobacteria bacterium]
MRNVVISAFVRSPFTLSKRGALAKMRPDDIAAQVIRGLIERTKVNVQDIEDVIVGCAFPEGEQGFNVARIISLLADLPLHVGGMTVNRFCGSSMQAIHDAAGAIQMNAGEVFICAGVESMTRIPMGGYNPMPNPTLAKDKPEAYMAMGITAENVAQRYQISRKAQEEFSVISHQKATKADQDGKFKDEIIPIRVGNTIIDRDGCIRPETSAEILSKLDLAFDQQGTVTAGTSSPLTDGASAVLVCSEDYAKKHNLPILARIKSIAVAGCGPEVMGIGPVEATRKALKRANLTEKDIDIVEINEAFASQSLACLQDLMIDHKKVNLDGGAIALGHPLGATGARITGKAAQLLKREGKKYALSTQCIGGGQGIATILEAA